MATLPDWHRRKRRRRLLLLPLAALLLLIVGLRFFPSAAVPIVRERPLFGDVPLDEADEISWRIGHGDRIGPLLQEWGVSGAEAAQLVAAVRPVYDLARINEGQALSLFVRRGRLERLLYPLDRERYLEVAFKPENRFPAAIYHFPYEVRQELVRIAIADNLSDSTVRAGEKLELAKELATLFEYDVDFNRDIQPNDELSALVEKKYLFGRFAVYGDILAAELDNNGKRLQVVRFPLEGRSLYFHPDGRSNRKMFLRSPLPFTPRVTSRYGWRQHPVLGFSARHLGVDFGAPVGTQVRTTAAGVIRAAGRDRLRGIYAEIRHPNGYSSQYFHLSHLAQGVRVMKRVEQGEVIGYVGNSGLSTGPHLHYGLLNNGRFLNPLTVQSPSVQPLPRERWQEFQNYCLQVLPQLEKK